MAKSRKKPPPQTTRKSRRIMVVDDNEDSAESLVELLKLSGHDAQFVVDANAALDLLPQFKPEVMFIDLSLPEIDGFELARRIRDQKAVPAPRMIALTGHEQDAMRQRALKSGFDKYLVKPLTFEEIEKVV